MTIIGNISSTIRLSIQSDRTASMSLPLPPRGMGSNCECRWFQWMSMIGLRDLVSLLCVCVWDLSASPPSDKGIVYIYNCLCVSSSCTLPLPHSLYACRLLQIPLFLFLEWYSPNFNPSTLSKHNITFLYFSQTHPLSCAHPEWFVYPLYGECLVNRLWLLRLFADHQFTVVVDVVLCNITY